MVTTTCPCCGAPAPAGLRVLRPHSMLARDGKLMRVPGRVVALAALLQASPRTAVGIAQGLLGDKDALGLTAVYISQLRNVLKPLGAAVELRAGRYHLVEREQS